MNKQRYRIIFNQLRGVWVAVAEHVCATGRLKRAHTEKCAHLPHPADHMLIDLSRAFSWLVLAYGGMFSIMPVQADIVADPTAPAQQQPFITNAANGVPLVNIQIPDSHGLSHNTYQQFDVMQKGVILNNSRNNVQTQLGGWVQGNPNMAAGAASTILNEVNSSRPSLLNGFIEVAGSRAQVIVANPSGITCNGCGFINAWRATLVTGSPVFSGGDLSAYRVTGSVIQFLGTGLDTRAMDYTDIISRAVVANSGIWAQKLNVVLGSQQVNVASNGDIGTLTPLATHPEPAPQVALDVAALGGMYAGKIHLIGTELGLGVNNQGVISASAGELSIDINGQLVNQGRLISQGNMALKSASIKNTSEVLSGAAMRIDTGDLDNQHQITAAESLAVNAQRISNSNAVLGAGQDINIQADLLSGDGRVMAGGHLTANLQQNYVQTTGLMQADGDLSLSSQGSILNQSNILAGKKLAIQADSLSNEGVLTGQDTGLNIAHTFTNTGLIDGKSTFIYADALSNQGKGQIFGDHLGIQARRLNNLAQTVDAVTSAATIAARNRLDLGVSEALVNQSKSLIYSQGDLVMGRELDASQIATGQGDSLLNTDATIEAAGNMHLNMASIQNLNAGVTTESVAVGTVNYDQFTPRDESGLYNSEDYPLWQIGNQGISWRYGSSYNQPFNFREYWRYIYSGTTYETRIKTSQPAEIIAGQNLSLTGNVINSDSRMIAGSHLTHTGGSLNNNNTTGNTTTSYSGTAYYYDYDGSGKGFSYDVSTSPYYPAPVVTTDLLPTTQYLAQTAANNNVTIASQSANALGNQKTDEAQIHTLSSLYRQTAPGASYLIETDPQFANYGQWLSSDYMLKALSYDPVYQTKRLGDGFYEQRLVREQINQLTGRRFLTGYSNDQAQYQALMNNGVTFANAQQLVPGVALSATQVAQLTSDIVWLVTQTVKLPDGSTSQALVPQVYTHLKAGDLTGAGSLMSGQTLDINLNTARGGHLINSGTLAGQQVLSIQAANIQNLMGSMAGQQVSLNAGQDILNQGGTITAQQSLALNAGRDIRVESTTINSNNSAQTGLQKGVLGYSERTGISRVAGLYVTDSANAVLVAAAGRDMQLGAAQVTNNSLNGVAELSAGQNIDLTTRQTALSTSTGSAKSYIKRSMTEEIGTTINTQADMKLQAGQDITARAATLHSEKGAINAQADHDISIEAGRLTEEVDAYRKTRKSGIFSTTTKERRDTVRTNDSLSSQISAETVTFKAGNDIAIQGSQLNAEGALKLAAGEAITITSAENTREETHLRKIKQSSTALGSATSISLMANGAGANAARLMTGKKALDNTTTYETTQTGSSISAGSVDISSQADTIVHASQIVADGEVTINAGQNLHLSAAQNSFIQDSIIKRKTSGYTGENAFDQSIGSKKQSQNTSFSSTSHVGSTVGSIGGNVSLTSGKTYTQITSDVLAPQGNIEIAAQQVNIVAAQNTDTTEQTSKFSQSGISASISNPVLTALNTTRQMKQAASQTSDSRMQALAAATTALTAKNTADAVINSPGSAGGINLNISLGSSKSKNTTTQTSNTAQGSQVTAGQNINITASGAGEKSDLTVIGSQIKAGENVTLKADDQINLLAAQNASSLDSKNKGSSASVGMSIGTDGLLFTAAASGSKGKANGTDTTWAETKVEAGNKAAIESGTDTNLIGAQVKAKQVMANVGTSGQGNLNIESLQDTSTYKDKQQGMGGSVSVGYGRWGASANMSNTKINSDYASVNEQAGIYAGDGGFQVNVKGNTDLKGAVIASTEQAIQNNKNNLTTDTLTTSDIKNKAEYQGKASSFSAGVGTTQQPNGLYKNAPTAAAGYAKESDDASSTTVSAISGGSVTIKDNTAQQTISGKDVISTLATLNRDVKVYAQGQAIDSNGNSTASTLTPVFDKDKLQRELNAKVQITQAFSQVAPKAVGDYAQKKLREAYDKTELASDLSNGLSDQERRELRSQADDLTKAWSENGYARVALHSLIGGLAGNLEGALGAGTSALTIPQIVAEIDKLNVPSEVKQALLMAAGTATGSVVGNTAGAGSALSEVTNNFLTHLEENQKLKAMKEKSACAAKDDACAQKAQSEIDRLEGLDAKREKELAPYLAACMQEVSVGNCMEIARKLVVVNNFGIISQTEESVGKTGSPYSFNKCGSTDAGGCSYGAWQLAAESGGLQEFMGYLEQRAKAGATDAQTFLDTLNKAGGVKVTQRQDSYKLAKKAYEEAQKVKAPDLTEKKNIFELEKAKLLEVQTPFMEKFMDLTLHDSQFIEYQFESISRGSNMKVVREWLDTYGAGFENLTVEQKEALFSETVQFGKATKESLRYALSDPDQNQEGFSPKQFTKNQQDFWNKESEYDDLKRKEDKLENERKKLSNEREKLSNEREKIKDQLIELLSSKASARQQQSLENKIKLLNSKVQVVDTKVQAVDTKIQKIQEDKKAVHEWMLNKAKASTEDREDFINDLYDHRILLRPSEKARYDRERNRLLNQIREQHSND